MKKHFFIYILGVSLFLGSSETIFFYLYKVAIKLCTYHIISDLICGITSRYIIVVEIKMCLLSRGKRILSISLYIIVTLHFQIRSSTSTKHWRYVWYISKQVLSTNDTFYSCIDLNPERTISLADWAVTITFRLSLKNNHCHGIYVTSDTPWQYPRVFDIKFETATIFFITRTKKWLFVNFSHNYKNNVHLKKF